jgi:hypothetical protein
MAFQGLETQKPRIYQIPPKCDDTKSSQKKTWLEHGQKMVARTWPKNQKLNMEDHVASTPTGHERKPIPVSAPDIPLPTPAS